MRKIVILSLSILIFLVSGCGDSNFKSTSKVTALFKIFTGNTDIFELDENGKHIKIFDTNDSFQSYILDINNTSMPEGNRRGILPLLTQNIDFEQNNLLLIDFGRQAPNGFDERIYELSESSVAIDLKVNPYNIGLPSVITNIFGYMVDKQIKDIHFKDIDLNDTYIIDFDEKRYLKIEK